METNVHDLLQRAANDAKVAYEYNLDKPKHMRISRVGQPLVSLLLDDFVFRKLPTLPIKSLTERAQNAETIKRKIAQAMGYVFEQTVIDILCSNPNVKVLPQYKVDLGYLSGTADIVVVNEAESRVSVVECKALKYGTKKDACKYALFNDHSTGYLSQLTVYRHALQQEFKNHEVQAYWMLFCKATAQTFKVSLSESNVDEDALMLDVKLKCEEYKRFDVVRSFLDIEECLRILDLSTLPLKTPVYDYFMPACSAHYNPWMGLLVDETGLPWEEADEHLRLMLKVSLENNGQAKETLLQLIQET